MLLAYAIDGVDIRCVLHGGEQEYTAMAERS
jgi:hypothetical protein